MERELRRPGGPHLFFLYFPPKNTPVPHPTGTYVFIRGLVGAYQVGVETREPHDGQTEKKQTTASSTVPGVKEVNWQDRDILRAPRETDE